MNGDLSGDDRYSELRETIAIGGTRSGLICERDMRYEIRCMWPRTHNHPDNILPGCAAIWQMTVSGVSCSRGKSHITSYVHKGASVSLLWHDTLVIDSGECRDMNV